MDLDLKEQKLLNLNRELQEISYGGNTEEEISRLRKVKHELENRIAEQVCTMFYFVSSSRMLFV